MSLYGEILPGRLELLTIYYCNGDVEIGEVLMPNGKRDVIPSHFQLRHFMTDDPFALERHQGQRRLEPRMDTDFVCFTDFQL